MKNGNGSSAGLDRAYIFFMANYFAQGMIGIAYEPISYLQKDVLGLSAAQSATFAACMSLPFLVKPFMGTLSDALPLWGRRRVPYLYISSAATCLVWAALAAMRGYPYLPTLAFLTLVNVGIAFTDVLCDAVMVEKGNQQAKTGSYQAAQIGTLYAALLASGLGGGWLAAHASYRLVFALTAAFPLLIFAATLLVSEEPSSKPALAARRTLRSLLDLAKSRSFWAASAVIFLYNFNPFQGTAFFYFQNDVLHFSKIFIGGLNSLTALAGVAGAYIFWRIYGRRLGAGGALLDTAYLVRASVLLGAPLTFLYLAYRGRASALVLTSSLGVASVIMRLSLMDLAAKASPAGGEATCFALYMSVFNLAAWGSNTAGGWLYGSWSAGSAGPHAAMAWLILLSAACTALCLPLLRWTSAPAAVSEPADLEILEAT